jgi:membrane protein YqaA with SNARE-associated domain
VIVGAWLALAVMGGVVGWVVGDWIGEKWCDPWQSHETRETNE